ncbi:MAG: hypothetical protein ACRCTZ_14920 [Sarcina sp.]
MLGFLKWYFIASRTCLFIFLLMLCHKMHKKKDKYEYRRYVLESIGVCIGTMITLEIMATGKALTLIGMFLEQTSEEFTNGISRKLASKEVEKEEVYECFKRLVHHFKRVEVTKKREIEEIENLKKAIRGTPLGADIVRELDFVKASLKLNYDSMRKVMGDEGFTTKELLYCSKRYNQEISKNNTTEEE